MKRTWRTANGDQLIEESEAGGCFCRMITGQDGEPLGTTFDYTVVDSDGQPKQTHEYSEGSGGWIAWATAYRVEGDKFLEYSCMQEERNPWAVKIRVVFEGLTLRRDS